jgi:rare lipoprotein A
MRTRRLGLWVYWPAVAGLISMIGSGVSADANISRETPSAATNPVAVAMTPAPAVIPVAATETTAAALAEVPPGGADSGSTHEADQVGIASWYGHQEQGRLTASGERFDQRKLTAAHRTLPLDTKVKVTNLENGKSIEVKVNDRGPYIPGRVLDLSTQAAKLLGMEKEGLALVRIEILPQQVAAVN